MTCARLQDSVVQDLPVRGRIISEFEVSLVKDSQGYVEEPCLEKQGWERAWKMYQGLLISDLL